MYAVPRRASLHFVRIGMAIALAAVLPIWTAPALHAQATGVIRGTVREAGSGRPLPGAQVSIKNTQRGAVANAEGVFSIAGAPAGQHTIRVDLIGYRSVEQVVSVTAGQPVSIDLELQQSAIGLDQIVVTGTTGRGQAKKTLGNSVSSINAAGITDVAPINNVQQLLQGRTPGMTMMSSTGVVGGGSRMRIRGSSSITAGNEPVVFVDGVRVQSGQSRTEGNTSQPVNLLEAFNPQDIESIEIIKGPAAATLYGAEAATGVIQIITKKGRPAEGLQWNANMEFGEVDWAVDQITTYWLCTDARIDDAANNPGCQVFNKNQPLSERLLEDRPLDPARRSEGVKHIYQQRGWTEDYPCLYPQQAPCDPTPLRTGWTRNMNLSVRGGGEAYNFYISGEKNDENGTFNNNFNNRLSGRANFGFVPSTNANFNVNVGYAQLDQQIPQSDNSSNSVLRNSYRGQAGGPAGQYLPGFRNYHPEFSNKYARHVEQERLTMGITAQYTPFSWWQNKLTVGLDRRESQNINGNNIDQTGGILYSGNNAGGSINIGTDKIFLWTVDYSGSVNHSLTDAWTSGFSAGMQMTKRSADSYDVSGTGFVANQLNLVSSAANRSAGQGFSEQTSLGFYVQEQVGYRDRIFATAAVRVDDNSAFGQDFSLVVYPKASLSWVISDESFFNIPWVDELKLRGAWGQAGNAPGPFSADRTYNTGRAVVADAAVNTLGTSAYGNPNLKAETGSEIELGFDGSLLSGKVGLDLTYYNRRTKDALLSVSDPPSSGWTGSHLVNVGEIKNSGLELSLNTTLLAREKVEWDLLATIGTNNNELISFGRDDEGNPILVEQRMGAFLSVQRHREGYPLGGYWSIDVRRDANGNPILDANGAAILKECLIWDPENPESCEEEFVGSPFPTRQVGLTNTIRLLKNVQLYSFFDYQGGHYQWCAICSVRTRTDLNSREINDPDLTTEERAVLASTQTKKYIYPADFIKLRELSLTYTVPRQYTERLGFNRTSVTLSGRNLWIWTKYKGNADPEVAFTGDASFDTADYGSIPMQRRLSLTFNFGF